MQCFFFKSRTACTRFKTDVRVGDETDAVSVPEMGLKTLICQARRKDHKRTIDSMTYNVLYGLNFICLGRK